MGVDRADLVVSLGASIVAGAAMGRYVQWAAGVIPVIGALYGGSDPLVGWITHEFHSVVFGLVFVSFLALLQADGAGDRLLLRVGVAIAWSLALWIVVAGVIMPVWLNLVVVPTPIPNVSSASFVGHLLWRVTLGGAYHLGTVAFARHRGPDRRQVVAGPGGAAAVGVDTNTYFPRRQDPGDMDLEIAGNTALVAASSSGLGRASAAALADEGADVVINGRDADRLERTAAALRESAAGEVYPVAADLTDPAAVEALVATTVAEFGGIDHLVTNAGGPPSGPFLETTADDWQDAYELLVRSATGLCRAASEPLRADGGGTIVSITSKSVKEAADGLVLSNSVRMAVVGLAKTLANEWAPEVRANVVMPGSHATERMEELARQAHERGDYGTLAAARESFVEGVPAGRMGDPERFGRVVAFLSGEPTSFVNGAALMVDGGEAGSIL